MSTPTRDTPLVSVAIPLFKSRRFLHCIIENIQGIDYPNVEIIVSDRHCFDDTLEALTETFKDDPRVRFLNGADRLTWIEHYNLLLQVASGKYFLWMPHDDSYSSNYISALVAYLEEQSDAILAFGRLEAIDSPGFAPFPSAYPPPPLKNAEPWTLGTALRLLLLWSIWIPSRGVFVRDRVIQSNLFIRNSRGTVGADYYWVFGLAVKGRLGYVPSCWCKKRRYPTSTCAQWRYRIHHVIDGPRLLCAYLRDLSGTPRLTLHRLAPILIWGLWPIAVVASAAQPRVPDMVRKLLRMVLVVVLRPFIGA